MMEGNSEKIKEDTSSEYHKIFFVRKKNYFIQGNLRHVTYTSYMIIQTSEKDVVYNHYSELQSCDVILSDPVQILLKLN